MKKIPPGSIVCATDFSSNAAQACLAAAAIARRCAKPLILVHMADQFNAWGATKGELARLLHPLRRRLRMEARRLAATGVVVSSEVLHGRLAEQAIPAFASEHDAELVVVSAVSKTAFDRWTVGSVSEQVAESATVPVLVVRSSAPFESWARGERPLKVLAGTDFSETAEAPLRWLGRLRKCGPCDVTACYVDWPPEEQQRLGVHGSMPLPANIPEVQRILERDLHERVVGMLGAEPFDVRVEAGWGRPDVSLVELARTMPADMVVIGTHQHGGFGKFVSVSRGILRHAPMSVACVPAGPGPSPGAKVRPGRRVLVAIDSSENGGPALPYAYSVVEDGGTVHLVHVQKPGRPAGRAGHGAGAGSFSPNGVGRKIEGASARRLIPTGAEKRGIITGVEIIRDDDVARAICQAAERVNADIVCLGRRRRAARSISNEVLKRCPRPVLVVKAPLA